MKKKTCLSSKPSMQKLIVVASLSAALLCGYQVRPALAETTDTSTTTTPVVTTETTSTSENASPTATENSQPASPAAPASPATPTTNQTPAAPTENTSPTPQSSGWRQENGQFHYYKEDGILVTSQWIKDDSGWHYVDASGNAAKGWYTTPNGKTWYFDPSQNAYPAFVGAHVIDGKAYFFDEGYGLVTKGWVHHQDGTRSYIDSDGSFHSDWKQLPNGKWFYFDTEDPFHRMKVGVVQLSSGTFYVDENAGMTSKNWVRLPNGGWAWAQSSGAFASGWFNTPNGKTWYFDPSDPQHPAAIGETQINNKYYYFDEGYGLRRNGWVHRTDDSWSWADTDGTFHSEWKQLPNGKWFYFDSEDPHHRLSVGVIKISSGTYNIDVDAGMTSNGWVQLPTREWAWAQSSGAFASGWFNTPNGKTWYFDSTKLGNPAYIGEHSINGKDYYFDEGYGLIRNSWVTLTNGVKRWAGPDGMLTGRLSPNGIFTADNGTQPTGTVKLPGLTLHIGSDHKVKTGWVKENGKDYYYLNDGSAASDWVNIQGTYYYFNTNGEKQTGWVHLKSGWYYLGADGKMRTIILIPTELW